MDIKGLKRDSKKVLEDWVTQRDNRIITKGGCKLYIPVRFTEHGLAFVGAETQCLGLCAIVIEKNYAVLSINGMISIDPSSTRIIDIGEDKYYEFEFDKGSTVITNTNIIRQDTLLYSIYNEVVAKGRIPWYLSYEDVGKIFTTAKYHGGVTLAANNAIFEMIVATMSRQQKDRTKYYRHGVDNLEHQIVNPPAFIPFRSPIYGATNTTAKMIGAYFDDSITSALTSPSEKVEGVEALLRK